MYTLFKTKFMIICVPLSSQSIAKRCSSSSCVETILTELKMTRVVMTNMINVTIVSNDISSILLEKMSDWSTNHH